MIAKLIHKNDCYYCSECRIKQNKMIEPYCSFCGATFSNFEEELIKIFSEEKEQTNG